MAKKVVPQEACPFCAADPCTCVARGSRVRRTKIVCPGCGEEICVCEGGTHDGKLL
jgi:hypothetical protein